MQLWNPQYKTLDHWRGIAALWVMLFHSFGTTYDKSLHPMVEILKSIASSGWLGVHLFFVISGYCIAASVYNLSGKKDSSWKFIKNRFWRLLPTYWVAFLVTIAINLISSPFNKTNFLDNFPSNWQSWMGNVFLIQPYLQVPFYVVVYWSLVVEIGFYIICACFLAIRNQVHTDKIIILLALALALISFVINYDSRLGFIIYWPEFFCGMLLFNALLSKYKNHRYQHNLYLSLMTGMVIIGLFLTIKLHNYQLLFSSIFSIILYFQYFIDNKISSIYIIKWLKVIGLMSYSFYLLHLPFGGRVISLGIRFITVQSSTFFLVQIFSWIVAISASYIFYRLVEKPLNEWRHRQQVVTN
ncbi:putative acyltransferase [Tolypothrix tenuis PCC 7101]|uniref:Putative acyltransferase n=1 Tax=Tolypothrix tenuis PCC 7101 TaxID=231146 RepID=A0A1Z4N810_9CYAN|nr:acyltransferase [Aulosira sp. FACHB-113]BAZ01856.1 putative acyltransferase [Tolypothrix tenuis PCC 7101]BAZ74219.1 putative acyltransferase [Aulosira laxa NIES-50]